MLMHDPLMEHIAVAARYNAGVLVLPLVIAGLLQMEDFCVRRSSLVFSGTTANLLYCLYEN